MPILKLFVQLAKGEIFNYWDTPNDKCVKSGPTTYVSPRGYVRKIDPYVAIFTEKPKNNIKSIYDQTTGEI